MPINPATTAAAGQPAVLGRARSAGRLAVALRRSWRSSMAKIVPNAVAWIVGLVGLVPFAWMIMGALKSRADVGDNPLGLPAVWHWENIAEAWRVGHFDRYFMNSVYIAVPTVVGVLVLSTLASYAFATMRFPGRNLLFVLFLLGFTIPFDILVIPLFYDLLTLKLLDTYWAVILPTVAITLPFGILLLRSFMEDLPREIFDAARIDGCSSFSLLHAIVVPLCRPALTSLLIFTFMWTWNEFMLPLVVLRNDAMRTIPAGLNYYQGRYVTNVPLLLAGAVISFLPVVLVYFIFQREFIRGIAAGAFK